MGLRLWQRLLHRDSLDHREQQAKLAAPAEIDEPPAMSEVLSSVTAANAMLDETSSRLPRLQLAATAGIARHALEDSARAVTRAHPTALELARYQSESTRLRERLKSLDA